MCSIFQDNKSWYEVSRLAENRWQIPKSTILAFMHQESSFQADARPPRQKLLGIIPWLRPTSAYGYAQVTDGTWEEYKQETNQTFVFRNYFKHAADFIGWYNNKSVQILGISRFDARNLYLAYHEGRNGYKNKSYQKKKWLLKIADKVKQQSNVFKRQMKSCKI